MACRRMAESLDGLGQAQVAVEYANQALQQSMVRGAEGLWRERRAAERAEGRPQERPGSRIMIWSGRHAFRGAGRGSLHMSL